MASEAFNKRRKLLSGKQNQDLRKKLAGCLVSGGLDILWLFGDILWTRNMDSEKEGQKQIQDLQIKRESGMVIKLENGVY